MNTEEVNKLMQLYREGRTTLQEEKLLLGHQGISLPGEGAWFNFARLHRKNAPESLEMDIMAIIRKKKKKKRLIARMGSAAAILIAAIITIVLAVPVRQDIMTYNEKVDAIQEALDMFKPTLSAEAGKEIIYEDDILIIYIK